MRESHGEGLARHADPEPCGDRREAAAEALEGAHAGQVLSREITSTGTPTPLTEAEGNIIDGDRGESSMGSARSQTLKEGAAFRRMRGNSLHGNRETPEASAGTDGAADRSEKATRRASGMHVSGESDGRVVPEQPAKSQDHSFWSLYERVSSVMARRTDEPPADGGRRPIVRNTDGPAASRTQCRESASPGLDRVREAARSDKRAKFTALLHHVTVDLLRESFSALKRVAAPGVDGVTWREYEEGLEARLADLHRRVHHGTYRAQPSKRAYIPKPDGKLRPLGITALEDKIVQRAVVTVLNAVYETEFLGFSYGFRPGRSQHDALDALHVGISDKKVSWVLDVDIRSFFDTIDHEWMMKFVGYRIADRRMLRLIAKWLKAGVSEDGQWSRTTVGTPQGAVASPLLANVYLHYVLDLWVNRWRTRHASGDVIIVRYADDFVMGFQHRHEAERFLTDLKERVEQFGLCLHPEKTRLIEFGRYADPNRRRRQEGKPATFDFLGFTHICGKRRKDGRFAVLRRTARKRLRDRLKTIRVALMKMRARPIHEQGQRLGRVVRGYLNYHAVPGNMRALNAFCTEVKRHWLHALRRRSQRHRMPWSRFRRLIARWLPSPRILHPYPNVRFYAAHPR